MPKYEEDDTTKLVANRLNTLAQIEAEGLDENFEEVKKDIDKFNDCTLFLEGILLRIETLGYRGETYDVGKADTKEVLDFLCSLYQEEQIEVSRPALRNWLVKNPPGSGSRELVYKLCFALKMDGEETEKFFLKNYLNRPFNYKNTHEAVYFWCMQNGRKYQEAVKIIEKIESTSEKNVPPLEMCTEQVGRKVKDICDEQELIEFLSKCRFGQEQQYMTATNKINELLEKCYPLATEEVKVFSQFYLELQPRFFQKNGDVKEINTEELLLEVIYGDVSDKGQLTSRVAQSRFPKLICKNFPKRQLFSNIQKHEASEDVIRKALIILVFYEFYATALLNAEKNASGDAMDFGEEYEDFKVELDDILLECGYVQMYVRNPFDFFIVYCAKTCNPLDTFRTLIAEYQMDVEE